MPGWTQAAQDHPHRAEDALVWAARAGLLTAPEATALREHVARCPAAGTELLAGLRSLRTLVAHETAAAVMCD